MQSSGSAILRPTGFAFEASGDLAIDTIRGLTMTLRRDLDRAEVAVCNGERRIGGGMIAIQRTGRWQGQIKIHGMPWNMLAERDETARAWRVTLTVPEQEK